VRTAGRENEVIAITSRAAVSALLRRRPRAEVAHDPRGLVGGNQLAPGRRVYKLDLFERPPVEAADILRRHLAYEQVVSREALDITRKE
jgi:hypothetical protein